MTLEEMILVIGEYSAKRFAKGAGRQELDTDLSELSDKIIKELERLYAIEKRLSDYIDSFESPVNDYPLVIPDSVVLVIFKDIRDGEKDSTS